MGDTIRIAAGPNEVSVVFDTAPPRDGPQFTIRVRTARNAHINVPARLSDVKALSIWLAKRIAEAEEPTDAVPENQLDMFQL
jgi:hypothetical protein